MSVKQRSQEAWVSPIFRKSDKIENGVLAANHYPRVEELRLDGTFGWLSDIPAFSDLCMLPPDWQQRNTNYISVLAKVLKCSVEDFPKDLVRFFTGAAKYPEKICNAGETGFGVHPVVASLPCIRASDAFCVFANSRYDYCAWSIGSGSHRIDPVVVSFLPYDQPELLETMEYDGVIPEVKKQIFKVAGNFEEFAFRIWTESLIYLNSCPSLHPDYVVRFDSFQLEYKNSLIRDGFAL